MIVNVKLFAFTSNDDLHLEYAPLCGEDHQKLADPGGEVTGGSDITDEGFVLDDVGLSVGLGVGLRVGLRIVGLEVGLREVGFIVRVPQATSSTVAREPPKRSAFAFLTISFLIRRGVQNGCAERIAAAMPATSDNIEYEEKIESISVWEVSWR